MASLRSCSTVSKMQDAFSEKNYLRRSFLNPTALVALGVTIPAHEAEQLWEGGASYP